MICQDQTSAEQDWAAAGAGRMFIYCSFGVSQPNAIPPINSDSILFEA